MRQVVFSQTAVRHFRKLPRAGRAAIREAVQRLGDRRASDRLTGCRVRRLSGYPEYVLRLDGWRVFYRVRDDVEVVMIGERRGARLVIDDEELGL